MKLQIGDVAKKHRSLTIRFSHLYDGGVVTRVESSRKLLVTDVVRGVADIQRLVAKSIQKLSLEGKEK